MNTQRKRDVARELNNRMFDLLGKEGLRAADLFETLAMLVISNFLAFGDLSGTDDRQMFEIMDDFAESMTLEYIRLRRIQASQPTSNSIN